MARFEESDWVGFCFRRVEFQGKRWHRRGRGEEVDNLNNSYITFRWENCLARFERTDWVDFCFRRVEFQERR